MNTKLVMSISAVLLALIGIGFTFFNAQLAVFTGTGLSITFQLFLQILGALFFGFAMLNWMARGNVLGGIYNRPIAISNFAHFFIGGAALVKAVINYPGLSYAVWVLAFLYVLFALLFGAILFRNPTKKVQAINV